MKQPLANVLIAGCMTICACGSVIAQDGPGGLPSTPGRPLNPIPPLPSGSTPKTAEQLVRVRSAADVNVVSPGQKFHLAFVFEIEKEWHIYWKNSGASGGPTHITVSGPPDFTIGKTLYPRPMQIESEDGVTYGYENKVVIYVEVTAPAALTSGHVSFNAKVNWMVCKNVCLIGRATQTINVITAERDGGRTLPPITPTDPAIASFKSNLPQPLEKLNGAEAAYSAGVLTVKLPVSSASNAQFFPDDTPGVTYDQPTAKREGDLLVLTVPVTVRPGNALGRPLRIAGTVGVGDRQTEPCFDIELPLPAT